MQYHTTEFLTQLQKVAKRRKPAAVQMQMGCEEQENLLSQLLAMGY